MLSVAKYDHAREITSWDIWILKANATQWLKSGEPMAFYSISGLNGFPACELDC